MDIIEEKTEDQYLLEGIDIHDKEQAKKIERLKEIHKKNAEIMEGQNGTGKNIKELHLHHGLLLDYIDSAYDKIQGFLSNKRAKVLKALDERMA